MKPVYLFLSAICIFFTSCFDILNRRSYEPTKRTAWVAVYTADTSYKKVEYQAPRMVVNPGKIYVKGSLIYQCEIGKGIHVIDNSSPSSAKRIGFLRIEGAEEISIFGNMLYTNNYYDLITIDISSPAAVKVIDRKKQAFYASTTSQDRFHTWERPPSSGYFVCPRFYADSVIARWDKKDSVIAYCYQQ
jgi:hypothetical protein